MARHSLAIQTVLAVFHEDQDRQTINTILEPCCKVIFARNVHEAWAVLQSERVAVVISDARFPGGTWKDLLLKLQQSAHPQPLVVADRLADCQLWSEVLNLGGYDLLLKPFDSHEVLRTLTLACRVRPKTASA